MELNVYSPANMIITVVPVDSLVEQYPEVSRKSYSYLAGKLPILKALWFGGEYADSSGRSTGLVHEKAVEFGYEGSGSAVNLHLALFESIGCLTREIKGRRCYRNTLVQLPDVWYDRIVREVQTPIAEPVVEEVVKEQEKIVLQDDVLGTVSEQVAAALLQQCIDIIQSGSKLDADQTIQHLRKELLKVEVRLGQQTEETQVVRRKMVEVRDELDAVKYERDGLRTKVRALESNIKQLLSPDADSFVRDRVNKAIDQVMREKPRHHER